MKILCRTISRIRFCQKPRLVAQTVQFKYKLVKANRVGYKIQKRIDAIFLCILDKQVYDIR